MQIEDRIRQRKLPWPFENNYMKNSTILSWSLHQKKIRAKVATRAFMKFLPGKLMMVHFDKIIEHNHNDIERS